MDEPAQRRLQTESALREAVADAYARARREVFDLGLREGSPSLTQRQREVLDALEHAETELRRFRNHDR